MNTCLSRMPRIKREQLLPSSGIYYVSRVYISALHGAVEGCDGLHAFSGGSILLRIFHSSFYKRGPS